MGLEALEQQLEEEICELVLFTSLEAGDAPVLQAHQLLFWTILSAAFPFGGGGSLPVRVPGSVAAEQGPSCHVSELPKIFQASSRRPAGSCFGTFPLGRG